MRQLICVLCVLVSCKDGAASGELSPAGRTLHLNERNFSDQLRMEQDQHQHQQVLGSVPGSAFTLKVQVSDMVNCQYLSQALVEVYVNYTRTNTALTGEDGGVVLHVAYQLGLPITIVASRDGYLCTLLPCKTSRMPIFSSVAMSLLGLTQGNIWLFEDSVFITAKTSDASSHPTVQFPKRLLNLAEDSDVSSVKAYLTFPSLSTEDNKFLYALGIMSSKSGYMSIELSPVAAVSVRLFSRETELNVSGPIQITLRIPDNCGLQTSNIVPAWFFNRTTGGWMRKGLGMVVLVEGKLMWTFTAPHLGYWIAAPMSSSRGLMGLAIPIDFISHHSSFLMVFLGGMLVVITSLLVGVSCYSRRSLCETQEKMIHTSRVLVLRKDQTTSMSDSELFEVSSEDSGHSQDELNQSFTEKGDNQHNDSVISKHSDNVIANPKATGLGLIQFEENAVAIRLECAEPELNADANDLTSSPESSQPMTVPLSLKDSLFFYNQPVAIFHPPHFSFHLEEQPEQSQWSKSATLPRAGSSTNTPTEPMSKDSFTQTLLKGPSALQDQVVETEEQLGVPVGSQASSSTNSSRGHFGLPESVSVPGTLNKIGSNRHPCLGSELQGNSEHALAELSKIPSPLPPRAWFVSLEGKPAAEIHHNVSEQQRRRRPAESRETSLDSGVDMSELNQTAGRRAVTLERNATFVKSSKPAPPQ
ncbi:protein FAM171B-like [Myripristis murdjan]|uniref:protein FAM171B-like n=1 Tax=Myripristis murdjan TaxID=586833 RepID=UPI001175D8C8|nr:protein FAM171B-like [Myripristis murdjan]